MTEKRNVLVEGVVRRALAYVAGIGEEDVLPSTSLDGLGIESVGMVALRLVLEAELGIQISAEDVAKMVLANSVADVYGIVELLLHQPEMPRSHTL